LEWENIRETRNIGWAVRLKKHVIATLYEVLIQGTRISTLIIIYEIQEAAELIAIMRTSVSVNFYDIQNNVFLTQIPRRTCLFNTSNMTA
jgi:hypothetical protein